MAVTQATERCCERIETLVYVCAFVPMNGQSIIDAYQDDGKGLVLPNTVLDEAAGTITFREGAPLREIFYHDCSDEDFARAEAMLVPEPAAPRHIPVKTSAERYGKVSKVYIECTEDRAIPAVLQRQMHAQAKCDRVISMATSHSPFLAQPEELAAHLMSL
jgi:pimeloyl-ACP methyl ester carboxylesterase